MSRYADDTTLMVESEEEIKSLLMKVKEESEKVGLKSGMQTAEAGAWSPAPMETTQLQSTPTMLVITQARMAAVNRH